MLKILIKKQLLELFHSYFINRKTGKAKTPREWVSFLTLMILLFGGLGKAFHLMEAELGGAILGNGFNWLYFALVSLLAMVLGVFGSVFNTYAGVYLPKDNEFLKSLPIPERTILLARLSGVYVTSLMYSAWVWIPAMIAYWQIVPVNGLNVIFPILMMFVIALFVFVLSCILGWLVAIIASKTKGKSFVTLFLSIGVFVIYYVVYFKVVNSLSEIVNHIGALGITVKKWLYYVYLLGMGADGDPLSMLLVTGITLVLAVLCVFVLSKTFMKLSVVSVSGNESKKTKLSAEFKRKRIKTALLIREYKHFTSVSTWMLNGGFGLLLLPVGAVVLLIKSETIGEILPEIVRELPQLYTAMPLLLLASLCLILSTNAILPVSVSMEGKTLWQLQSLPIDPWDVLQAKERMCVQISIIPAAVFGVVCAILLKIHWWETVLIIVGTWFYILMISDFGLFLNLKMPNLEWNNVASLTKQSVSVLIYIFGGWGFCLILCLGGFFLMQWVEAWVILSGYSLLFAVLWLVLHHWLKTKGTTIFAFL